MTYYCKNCNNIVGHYYFTLNYCKYIKSKNFNKINFLNCNICNKFVGIECFNVCENCFGKYPIIGEENLFNWFQKYKKTTTKELNYETTCNSCNNYKFRNQHWFFKELIFYS